MSMPTIAITPTSVRGARKQIQAQRARGFTLTLSFPASELMQNRHDGRHWSYAAGEKADARREGYLQALACMTEAGYEPPPTGCYRVLMVFSPPDRRKRDVSNLHAAMKAHLDGIAQAMGVDDAMFIEHSQRMTGVPNDGRGHVIVTIQEIA